MRRPLLFWFLFGAWSLGAALLFANVAIKTDSNFLLPRFASSELRLVADQLRRGPASNVLLIGVSGAPPGVLALASDRLAAELRKTPTIGFVANGRAFLDPAVIAWAKAYRYLLDPPVTKDEFSVPALKRAFDRLLDSLSTSAALLGEDLVFSDPTGRMLRILAHYAQQDAPRPESGVWMSADGAFATLVARPSSDPLDLDGQAAAVAQVRASFQRVQRALDAEGKSGATLSLLVSGPGVFALDVRERIVSELSWLGTLTIACSIALAWFAFRSLSVLALLTFAVGVGLVAGVLAVRLVFGEVHGVTLTFGAMLTGLAIDYPIHVLVHAGTGGDIPRQLKSIWRTLHLSVFTTLAAFIPFTVSSFPGLAQLGVVSIGGILATYLVTRLLLPVFVGPDLLGRMPFRGLDLPRPSLRTAMWMRAAGAAAAGALLLWAAIGHGKIWEDNLAGLSPLSPAQRAADLKLRSSVQAVNPRFLLVVSDAERETVLQRSEAVAEYLAGLVARKRLAGFDAPSRYLPSLKSQQARKQALPPSDELRARVAAAAAGAPFRETAFDQFVADVERARSADTLLTPEAAASNVFGLRLGTLLFQHGGVWIGLITFQGEAVPLKEIAAADAVVAAKGRLIDLKEQADGLLASYRSEAVLWLGAGAALSLFALALGLRNAGSVLRAFAPVALAVVLTAALLLLLGVPLSLFHLMALSVVAGLGYDYALFLDRLRAREALDATTIHAVALCALTTISSYAILSLSQLPILNGIGLTVAVGCVLVLAVSALFALGTKRESDS